MNKRETLDRWSSRPKIAQVLPLRTRIILACAEGRTNKVVAEVLYLIFQTVGKWRSQFFAQTTGRTDGWAPPGPPRTI